MDVCVCTYTYVHTRMYVCMYVCMYVIRTYMNVLFFKPSYITKGVGCAQSFIFSPKQIRTLKKVFI